MTYQDEMEKWLHEEYSSSEDPESIFSMVTIFPERKLKITSYLEDKNGERISLKEMAIQINSFILKHLQEQSLTPVNSQIFPLICQFMISVVPRATDIEIANLIFTSPSLKQALMFYGMSSFLLSQYIQQHELKIITEEESLTDLEVQEYLEKGRQAEEKLRKTLGG